MLVRRARAVKVWWLMSVRRAQPPDGLKAIFDTTRESYTSNSTVVYCVKAIDSEVEKLRVTVEKIVLGREIKSEKIERLDNKIEEISRNLHTLGSMVTRLLQFVSQSYEDGYLETP